MGGRGGGASDVAPWVLACTCDCERWDPACLLRRHLPLRMLPHPLRPAGWHRLPRPRPRPVLVRASNHQRCACSHTCMQSGLQARLASCAAAAEPEPSFLAAQLRVQRQRGHEGQRQAGRVSPDAGAHRCNFNCVMGCSICSLWRWTCSSHALLASFTPTPRSCNVRLSEGMPQLAPPIGARPFMVFGVRRVGREGVHLAMQLCWPL